MWLTKLRVLFITDPLIFFATSIMGTVSLIVSLFSSTGRTQHGVARAWSRMLLRIARVKVAVEGLEKIAPGGSYVFVANHRSYFDVPVILPYISVQFRFLANKNLFGIPFIGYHLKRAGHLPVDSESARESLKSMSEAARIIQERDISILVFPEAERTYGELLPFKDGAAFIAIKAGVPIVPITLLGTREIMPRGSMIIKGGRVKMRIGDPISTLDLTLQDRTRLSQTLRDMIAECHKEPAARATSPVGRGCAAS
jgi:1-acyl-sn-glycerol-3-phosphate acyltransferase